MTITRATFPVFVAIMQDDLHDVYRNLRVIITLSPPQIVQLSLGFWSFLFGIWWCIFDVWGIAPKLYAWQHASFFSHMTQAHWGIASGAIGLWQLHALLWPLPRRPYQELRAVRAMSAWWTFQAIGFVFSGFPSTSILFYLGLALLSGWCRWRLNVRSSLKELPPLYSYPFVRPGTEQDA